MNAKPLLAEITQALNESSLEAILIGNAAAALHGANITTLDFDFLFRATPQNLKKLKQFAKLLDAIALKPFYPISKLYRVINDDKGLQVDFLENIHGIKSFASVRSRAEEVDFLGYSLKIACLDDVIKSKKAANRPQDLLVLGILEQVKNEKEKRKGISRSKKRK